MSLAVIVLALETSGTSGSAALAEAASDPPRVLGEVRLPPHERSARTLLPAVHQLLQHHSCQPADLGLIGVASGPGSFTGLRIGVVAAKTIAYATGAPLAAVHTLTAIAAGVGATEAPLWTILDAQRGELFATRFAPQSNLADCPEPTTEILAIDAWLERLSPGEVVAGPPLAKLAARLPPGVATAAESLWEPTAAAVAHLAIDLLRRGIQVDPLALAPNYYRKSAAEEKANR